MKQRTKIAAGGAVLLLAAGAWAAAWIFGEIRKAESEDPTVWEEDILAFERAARESPEPAGAVLFVGSSSIRFWSTLARDMAPLPVIQRGFGGAKLGDVVHYAERLINVHEPRAVVVFVGSNDIIPGAAKSPEVVLAGYQELVERVRAGLPDTPIYFISITPTGSRWEVWPIVKATNEAIRAFTETEPGLEFIEASNLFLGAEGRPNDELFRIDRLHLNAAGYARWTEVIRERLLRDLPPQ